MAPGRTPANRMGRRAKEKRKEESGRALPVRRDDQSPRHKAKPRLHGTTSEKKKEGTEDPMKFHYRVDLEIPDDWAGTPADRETYRQTEAAMLDQLRAACARIVPTTDSTWNVEPIRPELEVSGLVAIPFERPAGMDDLYRRGQELEQIERRGALDKPGQINIDARHATIHEAPEGKGKFARCGNCGTRYEITDDPTENHHRAMRHKDECGKGSAMYTEGQRRDLLNDFHQQPMQVAFRERAAAEIEAGADPARVALTGVSIFDPAPQRPQLTGATWPDGSPVKTPTGPLTYSETRNPAPPARWWQFWKWFR